ncbi:MAG TPA: hypothetical protein VJA21_30885 [Verrucomicrobiae bacterium]
MPLETTIAGITARLRQSKFSKEQALSGGTVPRTLQQTILRRAAETAWLSFGNDVVISF